MWDEQQQAVVIDNGSGSIKGGISGDENPRCCFPCKVGRSRWEGVMVGMEEKKSYVGWEATAKRSILDLSCPIEFGVISDWEDIKKIWHHCMYDQLKVTPEEHPLLLTETALNPLENKQYVT